MRTKLTLRLDQRLIRQAKAYARRSGKSVSEIVADFFTRLQDARPAAEERLSPPVRSLIGALRRSGVGEADYGRYLEEKHR